MALETFRQEDADQMKRVEKALVKVILPFRAKTPPALVCLALLRCARTVLRLAPVNEQKELMPILVAFLEGRVAPPGEKSILWTPDQVM